MAACRYYSAKQQRRIFYEWTLIAGKNDQPENAHAVGRLLQGQAAQVNLIPLNPTQGYDGTPTDREAAYRFQKILREYGLPAPCASAAASTSRRVAGSWRVRGNHDSCRGGPWSALESEDRASSDPASILPQITLPRPFAPVALASP